MSTFAYADPPYIGCAHRYKGEAGGAEEVDHEALIESLDRDFDGWALSCHVPSLRYLLPLCPEKTQVLSWCKPFAAWLPNPGPLFAWEPVLMKPLRMPSREAGYVRRKDWAAIPTHFNRPGAPRILGQKPPDFCVWLFEAAGLLPSDDFTDMFHGSGAVHQAWDGWCASLTGVPLQLEIAE